MKTVTFHEQEYEYYDWQVVGDFIFELAKQIIKSEIKFDRVIALAKGGITFSKALSDLANIPDVSTMQIEFYTGIGETAKTPVITQSLPVSIRSERILIVDDVVDTGETLELAIKYLQYHGAASIHSASLAAKPWAKQQPDFSVRQTEAWVIFPHEIREMIGILEKLWASKGDDGAKITAQLLEIGIPESEVALFRSLK